MFRNDPACDQDHQPARSLASMEESMNDDIRAQAKALRLALEPFRDVRPVMSINRLIAFLIVAESEGKSITEYARDAGVSNAVMVQELIRLSSRLVNNQPGPDLLERRADAHDPRTMAVNLTGKGRALLARTRAE
jgi:DNA-binding MarR family transcriptional regulator